MRNGLLVNKRKWFLIAAIFFMMAAICISIYEVPILVYADTQAAGTVNDGPVKIRTAPVDGDTVTTLSAGASVTVLNETDGSDGYRWMQIRFLDGGAETTGYIRSDFVSLEAMGGDAAAGGESGTQETGNNTENDVEDLTGNGEGTENGANGTETGIPVENAAGAASASAYQSGNTGIVDNTDLSVYVRSGAGTSYSALTKVSKGQVLVVLGQTTVSGTVWYQVSFENSSGSYTGFICGDYVTIKGAADTPAKGPESSEDEQYIVVLKEAGFPDSYCNQLLALHKKYPDWQFVPVLTGLDWNTVISNESRAGKNLVQSASNDSRKSTDGAAYDWAANVWYGYDGAGWVCASAEFISYCMDPRNFLDAKNIFQFETLEYAPYQSAAGVNNILLNTFMSGNYTDTDGAVRSYADTFVEVGSSLAVSPYHLASRCKQEQGVKGTSPLITGTYSGYEGYYNYFNIGAYTTSTGSAALNGLISAKNNGWDSIYKSISGGASVVANNYVKRGQNTIYFEKFNVVYANSLYSHQYMTNVMAAISEGSNMEKAYADKNQAFVFRIPVYSNMPESAVTFTDTGNPNNWLSSLTVSGYNLTPSFQGGVTEYSLVVDNSVSSINVGATAVASTSRITGTGNYSLNYGNNTISITCISQSGVSRTYTITVARENAPAAGTPIPVADGASITSAYPLGTYMTGIQPGTLAADVLAAITAGNCTVKILNADGSENTGTVGTGNKLAVYVGGTEVKQYDVVVYGDINGDAKISNVDVVLMQKQILGINALSGAYMEAANASKDGGITNKDLVILQKHILNISAISQ